MTKSIEMIDTPITVKPLLDDQMDFDKFLTKNYDLANIAWMKSRPFYKGTIEDIIVNDIPIADFIRIPLEFTVPNFIREIIVSPRDHVVWSSTTRANPVDVAWPVYKPEKYDYTSLATELLRLKSKGAKQDEFRMALPIGYCGVFSSNMSLRTIVKLCKFLLYMYEQTANYAFVETHKAITEACKTTEVTDKLFELAYMNYEEADFLSEYQETDTYGFSRVGALITWSGPTSLGLRTHIIRHRSVTVLDSVKSLFIDHKSTLPLLDLKTPIKLQATATKDVWDHVIGTRNCWIAQASLWQRMVDQYSDFMGLVRSPLPCDKEGKCPFKTDNELRIQGKDPNPVCGKYLKINNKSVSDEEMVKVRSYGKTRATWWELEF